MFLWGNAFLKLLFDLHVQRKSHANFINIVVDKVRPEQEPNYSYLSKIGNHFLIWCDPIFYKIQKYLDLKESSERRQCLIFLLLAQHLVGEFLVVSSDADIELHSRSLNHGHARNPTE